MKIFKNDRYLYAGVIGVVLMSAVIAVEAQTATNVIFPNIPDAPDNTAVTAATAASGVFQALSGKFGWIVTIFTVMGILRTLFKPVMLAIENVVANDPEKAKALADFEGGTIFKIISFVLDFGASIKLKTVAAATTTKS